MMGRAGEKVVFGETSLDSIAQDPSTKRGPRAQHFKGRIVAFLQNVKAVALAKSELKQQRARHPRQAMECQPSLGQTGMAYRAIERASRPAVENSGTVHSFPTAGVEIEKLG